MALNLSRLAGGIGFRIDGAAPHDRSGAATSVVDLNGDGISDLVIGAPSASPGGMGQAGETFVVYGTTNGFPDELDLGTLASESGFRADGIDWNHQSGSWVANAGDLNSDGVDDLAIVAPFDGPHSARVYVLYGSTNGFSETFDLANIDGDNGFRVHGIGHLFSGQDPVSGAGDLNGDGLDDLVIGAPSAGGEGRGRTYVVFGASGGIPVYLDVADLDGSNGFWLDGPNSRDYSGYAVAIAGDLNGDGLDDLAIGAPGGANSGRAYVVFGSTEEFAGIDLATLDGSDGFRIDGAQAHQAIGETIGRAGDVNGDGIEDLLVTGEGDAVYVIFGSTDGFDPNLKLADLDGADGFRLTGGTKEENFGWSTAAGDVNADGVGDLILGPGSGGGYPKTTYLVYGRAGTFAPTLDLESLDGEQGLRLEGADADSVAAGDINGDGVDDVIIGTTDAATVGVYDGASNTHVIFGTPQLGGADDAPSAADDDLVVGSGSVIDLTDDHGAGFDRDPDFNDLTITAIDGTSLDRGDSVVLGSGLRVTLTGSAEVRFDTSGVPFGATLYDDFSYEISDGQGGIDVASVSVQFIENDVRAVDGIGGFRIDWRKAGDRSGYAVASAGDVNGDGVDDMIIGAPYGGKHDAGRAWVVFGSAERFDPRLDLADLDGENGFVIRGADRYDHFGWSVAGAGDVNGDGIDDIVMGAPGGGEHNAGRTYVVFGSTRGYDARIYLDDLDGGNGFGVWGVNRHDQSGASVAGAGDVDGDGFDDIILSHLDAYYDGGQPARAYVVYGSPSGFEPRLDLSDGQEAFSLNASVGEVNVAGAGDINGDGFADLLIGAPDNGSYYSLDGFGFASVILGASDGFGPELSLYTDHDHGFGASVAAAGDVNGDGLDDLIVANRYTNMSYVVFGSEDFAGFSNDLDAELDGGNGFRLVGGGFSADGAGDFDGDGVDDLIVSSGSGDAFLIVGGVGGFTPTLDLATLSEEFRFTGAAGQVAGAGDLNDDGFDDLILGSPDADPRGRQDAGSSFVVYGHAMDDIISEIDIAHDGIDDIRLPRAIDASSTAPDPPFL